MKLPSEEAGTSLATILDQGEFEYWTITEHGAEFKPDTPREAWLDFMRKATLMYEQSGRLHFRSMCIVADGLNAGEALFGEEYAQAIDDTRKFMQVSAKTIHNAMWILKSVAPARRRETLTLAHHEAVAPLDPEEQDELLGKAESENMTVSALKKEVKTRHPTTKGGKTRKSGVDLKSEEGLQVAGGKLSEWITEHEKELTAAQLKRWKPILEPLFKFYRRKWQSGRAKQ